ncbi:hypothetical protein TNCV_2877241 [Trichonephila clavipes]|uniref:Uncharacterized protein n=1 Tax=Trichonephila clavipes TaxID=2585209 RepID=A0A8X6WDS1_TRICX|nr:hypothetical protein TNCV_2877241 [Trichonephila clavipes]
MHHSVSARTIQLRLLQSGISARRPLFRLPFPGNHMRSPRQWGDGQWIWTREWNGIVLTDESISACNIMMVGFEFGDTVVIGILEYSPEGSLVPYVTIDELDLRDPGMVGDAAPAHHIPNVLYWRDILGSLRPEKYWRSTKTSGRKTYHVPPALSF